VAFAVWVSEPWRAQLRDALGPVLAWAIPVSIAYVPGLVIGLMASTLLVARYREIPLTPPAGAWRVGTWPPVTIIIAARNEEDVIERTLEHIADLLYDGPVWVVLADNGSTDRTAACADAAAHRLGLRYDRVFEPKPGKHVALNTALATVATPFVVTVDADTLVQAESLTRLIARVAHSPQGQHLSACAAALLVANPTASFVTRMQQWDYRLGINGVKSMQGAYNTALVAQGAYSVYATADLRTIGGWPDAIGEDIVLTWSMLETCGITQYEPVAVGFTAAPVRLGRLLRQRSRWARGMFEGLRSHPPLRQPRILAKLVASIDYLVPVLDIGIVFFWVPGVVLFALGYPLIFSWWSMMLLPLTLALFGCFRRWQTQHVFRRLGIRPERDTRGFVGYLFVYQPLTSAAALRGYWQYLTGSRRRWK
jgi:biofilm PGA synthesis N-glycosyltransferase PgaC